MKNWWQGEFSFERRDDLVGVEREWYDDSTIRKKKVKGIFDNAMTNLVNKKVTKKRPKAGKLTMIRHPNKEKG